MAVLTTYVRMAPRRISSYLHMFIYLFYFICSSNLIVSVVSLCICFFPWGKQRVEDV
ncbi:uncharacterized protein BDW47DRAFT_98192 [Aspergillus candidus]|uniref:Uncharacterized protein n=1 Tax=Aspergillus candidus TaxID=41067 RepID=A0A2I2FNU1_ASPCN|nr:hypothetical protein BDW47DRAFT_98192 [Aspergillus candidus]PLB42278.1 hypothetical protein BDW47DRAFT_98192 [Aspergillus candidus]